MLITYEVLDYKMLKEDIIQKQINFLWEEKYKPLYCAMWQATKLTKFMWKKSTQSALKNEITRITPFLTNEVIMNTLKAQDEFFLPFIAELYSPTLAKDIELSGIYSHPGIIAKFKAILQDLPNQKDEAFVHYFLSSLYKANPHLLPDFEKMNTVPADLNLKSAKEAFSNTLLEGQKLLITAYEAQHLNTLKKVMLDNLNDAQPNNPQPQNLSSPGVFFSFPSNQKDIKTKYEKAILDTKNIKELTNLWEDIIKKVTINPEKNNLDQLLSIAQSMSSPAQINQKITKKQ